jgi:dsRNA-specific ribonuclease
VAAGPQNEAAAVQSGRDHWSAHKQSFDVECEIPELRLSERGIGGSRRSGEQAAAAAMLLTIKAKNQT